MVVIGDAKGKTFDDIDKVPHREYGLLLATSPITPTGAHNFYFDNRIKATVNLYKAHKIYIVIASGGDYTRTQTYGCDEPAAIRDSLVACGIPTNRIILDYDGTRTINSIIKAKEGYDANALVIISQKDHSQRALYLAEHYGINAICYNADEPQILNSRIKNRLREYFARVKMFFDLWFNSKPSYSNDPILTLTSMKVYFEYLCHIDGHIEQDTIVGNFTGHGTDTLYIETIPQLNEIGYTEYEENYVKSSNPNIPTMPLLGWWQIKPKIVYEGDVDGNGQDEWGYLVQGQNGQWRFYLIYTLINGEWRYLYYNNDAESNLLCTNEILRASGVDIVEKGDKKGFIKINYVTHVSDTQIHDTIVAATYTKITNENE
jgi:SanA protein